MTGSGPFAFDGPVEIIAHRGYSAAAPENTLAALELAMSAGADALEFDLHTALDGTPFLFHDDTLERTTDGTGPIAATAPERLALLDAGGWFDPRFRGEPVPTLQRALERVRGWAGRLYPEVKGWGVPADLVHLVGRVRAAGLLARTVFISMDWVALDGIREAEPEALVGYIVERSDRTEKALGKARGDPRALLDFDARILLANPAIGACAAAEGIELATWTVDSVPTAARLLAMGVPRITTNRVAELVAWKRSL